MSRAWRMLWLWKVVSVKAGKESFICTFLPILNPFQAPEHSCAESAETEGEVRYCKPSTPAL